MGLTTLLTMSVLLLIVAEQMPKTSEGLPLIGKNRPNIHLQNIINYDLQECTF